MHGRWLRAPLPARALVEGRRRGRRSMWLRVQISRAPLSRPCLDLRRVKEVPGEVGAQRELETSHGRQRFRLGPPLQPFLPRHDVLPELVLQQGLRELERAALVEMRVVRPIHSGHG